MPLINHQQQAARPLPLELRISWGDHSSLKAKWVIR